MKKTRFLSLVLVLALIVGLLPANGASALAASELKRYTVLVLDTSGDASFIGRNNETIYTAETAVEYVKTAAERFLECIADSPDENYVAIVSYDSDIKTVSDFSRDFDALKTKVSGLGASGSIRSIASGLDRAHSLLADTDATAIKNVVLFTTGMTNDGAYSYEGKYDGNTVGSEWYRIDTEINLYAYANAAITSAQAIKDEETDIYTIGLFKTMEGMPDEGKNIAAFFKLTAEDLASSSNYFYPVDDPSTLEFTFGLVAENILGQKVNGTFSFPSGDDYNYTSEFFYDDAYFSKSATLYQPSLATMSLCMAMAAFGSNGVDYPLKDKNARELYNKIGFDPIFTNNYYALRPSEDSMGVIIGSKDITIDGKTYTLIAVTTRGGGYEAEWAGNFTLGLMGRHQGFNTAASIVKTELNKYISNNRDKFADDIKLWIMGYSRGAATANLVAADITKAGGIGGINVSPEDIYAYCFEPPQGENTTNISKADAGNYTNIHNIVNPNDVVTKVAMRNWGFTRYGVDEPKIPTRLTSSNQAAFENMLEKFKALNTCGTTESIVTYQGRETHIIDSFEAVKIDPDIDFSVDLGHFELVHGKWFDYYKWVPGEGIDLDITLKQKTNKAMSAFLDDLVTALSLGFESRANYVAKLQPSVRVLISQLMGNGYEQYKWQRTGEIFEQKLDSNLGEIIRTYVFGGEEALTGLVTVYLLESMSEAGISAYNVAGYVMLPTAAKEALNSVVRAIISSLAISGTEDLLTLGYNAKKLLPAHYPELCLAWMQSQDVNYTPEGKELFIIDCYRVVHINCPVDVQVFDSNNRLVAAIISDVPQEIEGSLIEAEFTSDGEKRIYLPADEDYRIEITATGDGTLNYSIDEFSYETGGMAKLIQFNDIPIVTGDRLSGRADRFTEADIVSTGSGSNVDYSLSKNAEEIEPDKELKGEEAFEATYLVTVSTENEGSGTVFGGGAYSDGAFAQVNAVSDNECTFLGWYEDDVLISEEASYRFMVTGNRQLIAKFEGKHSYYDLPELGSNPSAEPEPTGAAEPIILVVPAQEPEAPEEPEVVVDIPEQPAVPEGEAVEAGLKKGFTFKAGSFNYRVLTDGVAEVTCTGFIKDKTKATIPAAVTYDGIKYKVTAIANAAFAGSAKLKTVTIGKNVKKIGSKAFYNCKVLSKVTVGKNVTAIGAKAFAGCTAVSELIVNSKKLTEAGIGAKAFKGISRSAVVYVPTGKGKAYMVLLTGAGMSKKATVKSK